MREVILNIVIPIVGLGKRFSDAGYSVPKPLVIVEGKTILQHAVESLKVQGKYTFVVRTSEFSEKMIDVLRSCKPDCNIVETSAMTSGSVSSILLAEDAINSEESLITTNCDQILKWDPVDFLSFCKRSQAHGVVCTYPFNDIRLFESSPYSFIHTNHFGRGLQLVEKEAISLNALCGVHYWKNGSSFVKSAKKLIEENKTINGEFYVSMTYNYLIREGKVVVPYSLYNGEFFSLGTPEDVSKYENRKVR